MSKGHFIRTGRRVESNENERLAQTKPIRYLRRSGRSEWRELMPALFDFSQSERIPVHFSMILVDRVELSEERYAHTCTRRAPIGDHSGSVALSKPNGSRKPLPTTRREDFPCHLREASSTNG